MGDRTPAWLAQASGIKDASVRKYLRGAQPTVIPAVALASALGVRLSWLLAGEGAMQGPEEPERPKAPLHQFFDAAEADWVFLPYYRFERAMDAFNPIVTETFPVRRDWVKRAFGVERGLWLTEMPTDELPSVAAAGETIVCRNVIVPEYGRAYILGQDGNLMVRRYSDVGFLSELAGIKPIEPAEANLNGFALVGVIVGKIGASPIR